MELVGRAAGGARDLVAQLRVREMAPAEVWGDIGEM